MKSLKVISLLILTLGFLACSQKAERKRIITVTIEPQRYFASQLADSLFEVVTMVPAGTSPETYDPSPTQMARLSQSMAYFCIGKIGFEEVWLDKIKANNAELNVFDNSEGIHFLTSEPEEHHHHDGESEGEHHHHPGGIDPHTWSSPKKALIIVQNMYQALVKLDPKNEPVYKENLKKLTSEIQETDRIVSDLLKSSPQKSFIIYHPALSYFAEDYGLTQYCIEMDGKEPSPDQLKTLVETAKSKEIKTIFVQLEFDRKNAEIIAKETGCKLVEINPLSFNWKEETIHIAKALSNE